MANIKKARSSEKQLDYLIDSMLNNKQFASGKFVSVQGKKQHNEMWEKLTRELNEIGPQKTAEQWKKVTILSHYYKLYINDINSLISQVWRNQKLLTRKKNSRIKISQGKTGNSSSFSELTEKEKKFLL